MSSRSTVVPIVFVVMLRCVGWAWAGPAYTVTVIPSLPGDVLGGAGGLNNAGQVIGGNYNLTTGGEDSYLWSGGTLTNLGYLPGGTTCTANAINDSGQIVGYGGTSETGGAFLYQNGTMTNLGALQGDWYSGAFGINASGQIAGYSSLFTDHAVVFSNGTITNLTASTGMVGIARAINGNGEVVGIGELTGHESGVCHAYDFTTKTDLGTLGGQNSDAYGINNSGQIVGYAATASGAWHPFLYSNGQMIDLGPLDGVYTEGIAGSINAAGQIVGYMEDPATSAERAFL